ncbi:hypothetical protein XA68_17741 [Ophiocordyceps unilateralis]|uniref:Calcium-channel protein CCH1 n=1 Tax=Ophiocordyceps unilateralis TaxID=268505 RepID=A0A2A9P3Z3_OPHUN|nr:hypothetical protein XA68_17741 [Ophiocordyceps unilateralis]
MLSPPNVDANQDGGLTADPLATDSPFGMSSSWCPAYNADDEAAGPESPINPTALQSALPLESWQPAVEDHHFEFASDILDDTLSPSPYTDELPNLGLLESDRVPLTALIQPIAGSFATGNYESRPEECFQSCCNVEDDFMRGRDKSMLGHALSMRQKSRSRRSYGISTSRDAYRLSHSPSNSGAFLRAGSVVRAMSQRVVNISGESETADRRTSHPCSRSPRQSGFDGERSPTRSMQLETPCFTERQQEHIQTEKTAVTSHVSLISAPPQFFHNSLKGNTLGIFSPSSRIRTFLCNLLIHPCTEPLILVLIMLQAILLTVESSSNVFTDGNGRPNAWGKRPIDWAMLGLFVVFTLELVSRIIVSGFVLNAAEYSTIDRRKGIWAAVTEQYRVMFQPQQETWLSRADPQTPAFSPTTATMAHGQQIPERQEDQQRFQLARRAFLRHSFNRLDFVAVVSYWFSFVIAVSGAEHRHHIYLFKMLSSLRILRLLALTHGTAIILRSLKKAAPLLVRVAFLICFFWLLFAIIGVQSFKSSLSRQCVWLDPSEPKSLPASFTVESEFCGGHLDNETGQLKPWVKFGSSKSLDELINGTGSGKGFICPRGSICLQQESPFNGTVNFDDIFHSLELVFVIMSANTFSDLMYATMGSDYLQAALFFGAGIMILMLWLTSLLIAVITSSFQVIREESKSSAFTVDAEPFAQSPPDERLRRPSTLQRLYDKTSLFWVIVIAFALVCQSSRSSTMSGARETFINLSEAIATICLDLEIIIRFTANWRRFHSSWRNIFDLGLAAITTVILVPPIRLSPAYLWLSVFQILRVYRIVLAIPVTRKLISLVLGNAAGIANLILFVFLMTFLVAIFASQLFRGAVAASRGNEPNRITFATIYNSFLGMYQVLSSENWTEILYSVTSYTADYRMAWIGAIFLIGWFVLSFFILVNMFIAVIQENFDVSEDEKRLEQVRAFLQRKELGQTSSNIALSTIFSFGRSRRRRDPLDYGPAMMEMLLKDAVVRDFLNDDVTKPLQDQARTGGIAPRSATTLFGSDVKAGFLSKLWAKLLQRSSERGPNPFYSNIRFDGPSDTMDPRQMARQAVSATSARRKAQREYLACHPRYNDSLYIFRPKNPFRLVCQRIVGSARGFERFDGVEPNKIAWYIFSVLVYAVVVAMVVLACVTTPLYQKEFREKHPDVVLGWYVWTDLAFAVFFTFEAGVKVIADGLLWTPNAYLRSSWGIIDSIVLLTLWINVVTLLVNDGAISRAVGAFKALRALRLLNVSDSARNTFHSLIIIGWWKLLGAAFISISLLIPFAVYGLNLFNGKMVACNDSDGLSILDGCFGEYGSTPFKDDWFMLSPRVASNPYFNFDDFGSSLFTLFQIVSQEGWTDVSFAAQSIVGRGKQPQSLAAEGNAMFFVVFNLMATVFVLTLFISVFMRNYTEQTGVAFLTAEQRSWLELRKLLRHISPSKSSYSGTEKKWKKWCHKRAVEKRGKWYQAITVILVLHLLLLVAEFRTEPLWWSRTRVYAFLIFVLIYLGNISIRIIGLGWARFRRSSWDLYSLVTVSGAFVATVALLIADTRAETYVQLHKFFLVAIVLLLIPRNDALDQLFKTAAASLTVIGNLLATWLVLFLVFAIAMTQTFSLTRFGGEETGNVNFRTVPKALILLFRMSLGEGWNKVMEDYAEIEPPLCVEQHRFFNSDCGSKAWARFLFVSWNIVSMYIFVNLFVSLIYESFSYVYQRSSGVAVVDREEIRRFKEAWRSVDPTGTGFITKEAFPRLLGELSGVFQMRVYEPQDSVRQILEDVRGEGQTSRHVSMTASRPSDEIDIVKLSKRLAMLDVEKIRKRRRRFKIFYGEVLASADPDKGVAFPDVLMILAHYNIINDSKSLRLAEFLRRRARLQRVDEEIRRKIVQGFFDTLYWSRKFKKHMERKRASRMSGVPELMVPDILVDEDGSDDFLKSSKVVEGSITRWTHVSTGEGAKQSTKTSAAKARQCGMGDQHPLSHPRSSATTATGQGASSGFSFELYEPERRPQRHDEWDERRGECAMSPAQARDTVEESVWADSIRRSAMLRRPVGGSR